MHARTRLATRMSSDGLGGDDVVFVPFDASQYILNSETHIEVRLWNNKRINKKDCHKWKDT